MSASTITRKFSLLPDTSDRVLKIKSYKETTDLLVKVRALKNKYVSLMVADVKANSYNSYNSTSMSRFRQAVYDNGLTLAKDAQFELVDALLLSPYVHSFAQLTLLPAFRRIWPSAYAAIEQGRQDQEWLESYSLSRSHTRAHRCSPWMTRSGLTRRPRCWPTANISVGRHQQ